MNEINTAHIRRCIEICRPYDRPIGSDALTTGALAELDEICRRLHEAEEFVDNIKNDYDVRVGDK
jgi:hypothetical protein